MSLARTDAASRDGASVSSVTFSSRSIGAAHSDRFVIVAAGANNPFDIADPPDTIACTLNGTPMISLTGLVLSNEGMGLDIWALPVASGTTANFVVTVTNPACANFGIAIYRLIVPDSGGAIVAHDVDSLTDPGNFSIDMVEDGVFIGACFTRDVSGGVGWSGNGVTEDIEFDTRSNEFFSVGLNTNTSEVSGAAVTLSSGGGAELAVAVTIAPCGAAPPVSVGLSPSLLTLSGESASWSLHTINVAAYAGRTVRLVLHYVSGSSFTGDIQIDDANLDGTAYDFEAADGWQVSTNQSSTYAGAAWSTLAIGTTAGQFNLDTGTTPSTGTGDLGAHGGSYFMYAETTDPGFPSVDYWARSPEVVLDSSPTLSLWVGREGATIGTLDVHLEVTE
jgi:hypothetical protein